jgi:hypothetical protein
LVGLAAVDAERSDVYLDLVLGALGVAARTALEAVVASKYEYQSEFARNYIAKGLAEGEARGEANALLRVLVARGFTVDEPTERRVRACSDLATLERWLTRAVTVATLGDVFADG